MTLRTPWVRALLRRLGIDRAVGYTLLSSGLARLAGPVQLLVIAQSLSKVEKGVYFSFGSLLALQVFFELGLSLVIAQFVSHERADLEFDAEGRLVGKNVSKVRLVAASRKAMLWYAIAAALVGATVLPAGWWFFATSEGAEGIAWQAPWIALVVVTMLNLLVAPILAILSGCGLVADSARLVLWQTLGGYLGTCATLLAGGKLFAAPVGASTALVAVAWGLSRPGRLRTCLSDLRAYPAPHGAVSWWREIWPFQWRIAVSWLSSYFLFQLFVLVLFRRDPETGPVEAGQMGMSMNVLMALTMTALTWINTRLPEAGRLIAQRRFDDLDRLFRGAAIRSFAFVGIGALGFVAAVGVLQFRGWGLGSSFLPVNLLGIAASATVLNHVLYMEAAYLRAHKQEPLLLVSVLFGGLVGLSTLVFGRLYGPAGMLWGYFMLSLIVGLGGGTMVFVAKRREWHHLP